MTHSFGGERIEYENRGETDENLLSQDVKDLLKNYGGNEIHKESGYVINSQYKEK